MTVVATYQSSLEFLVDIENLVRSIESLEHRYVLLRSVYSLIHYSSSIVCISTDLLSFSNLQEHLERDLFDR